MTSPRACTPDLPTDRFMLKGKSADGKAFTWCWFDSREARRAAPRLDGWTYSYARTRRIPSARLRAALAVVEVGRLVLLTPSSRAHQMLLGDTIAAFDALETSR